MMVKKKFLLIIRLRFLNKISNKFSYCKKIKNVDKEIQIDSSDHSSKASLSIVHHNSKNNRGWAQSQKINK
ncbi:hypothetical protein BpHYR1_019126 [Brachionus plicatilis]|uniref:Uncharacterized protein n=1 Tax=Brachionus plicatilis TaxID=10195 RepID=A0A3M7RH17_BRAPC|nr:hypothetical protein BpHYR1_019126 [Brachionus plicatilis]